MTTEQLAPFDPRAVPPLPVVDITMALDRSGREYALVDGVPVVSRAEETARQAAVRVVAELVDEIAAFDDLGRRSRAVRARVKGPDREPQMLLIHRERRVFVPSEGNDPTSAPHLIDNLSQAGQPMTGPRQPPPGHAAEREAVDESDWSQTFLDEIPPSPTAFTGLSFAVPAAIAAHTSTTTIDVPAPGLGPDSAHRLPEPVKAQVPPPAEGSELPQSAETGADLRPRSPHPAGPPELHRQRPSARQTQADIKARAALQTPIARQTPAPAVHRFWPIVAVATAAAIVLGSLAWSITALRSPTRAATPVRQSGAPTPKPATFPGVPPSGWAAKARWSTGPLDPSAGPVISVGTDAVAFVTAARVLTLADSGTGRPRWQVTLPENVSCKLARTQVAGQDVLAVQTTSRLMWWKIADGAPVGEVRLPAGAKTTYLGAAPLVGLDASSVGVIESGTLRQVRVPGGAFALAARADGTVTAASPQGWWHLRAGAPAGVVNPWEGIDTDQDAPKARPSIVGYLGSSILTLYPRDRTGRAHIVAHTDRSADVRVSFRGAVVPQSGPQRWFPAPNGTWGVLGRTLIDLQSGSVTDLGGWETTWVTADTAYGTVGGKPAAVGPAAPRGLRPEKEATPETSTSAGVAVRARSDQGESVYLLPPVS